MHLVYSHNEIRSSSGNKQTTTLPSNTGGAHTPNIKGKKPDTKGHVLSVMKFKKRPD